MNCEVRRRSWNFGSWNFGMAVPKITWSSKNRDANMLLVPTHRSLGHPHPLETFFTWKLAFNFSIKIRHVAFHLKKKLTAVKLILTLNVFKWIETQSLQLRGIRIQVIIFTSKYGIKYYRNFVLLKLRTQVFLFLSNYGLLYLKCLIILALSNSCNVYLVKYSLVIMVTSN